MDRLAALMTCFVAILIVLLALPSPSPAADPVPPRVPGVDRQEPQTHLVPIVPESRATWRPVAYRVTGYGRPSSCSPQYAQPATCSPQPATCYPVPAQPETRPPIDRGRIKDQVAGEFDRLTTDLVMQFRGELAAAIDRLQRRPDWIDVRAVDGLTGAETTERVQLGKRFTIYHLPPGPVPGR